MRFQKKHTQIKVINLLLFYSFFTFLFFPPKIKHHLHIKKKWNPHYILDLKKEFNQKPQNEQNHNLFFFAFPFIFLQMKKSQIPPRFRSPNSRKIKLPTSKFSSPSPLPKINTIPNKRPHFQFEKKKCQPKTHNEQNYIKQFPFPHSLSFQII